MIANLDTAFPYKPFCALRLFICTKHTKSACTHTHTRRNGFRLFFRLSGKKKIFMEISSAQQPLSCCFRSWISVLYYYVAVCTFTLVPLLLPSNGNEDSAKRYETGRLDFLCRSGCTVFADNTTRPAAVVAWALRKRVHQQGDKAFRRQLAQMPPCPPQKDLALLYLHF